MYFERRDFLRDLTRVPGTGHRAGTEFAVQITVLVVEAVVLVAIRLRVSARLVMAATCYLDVLHVSLQRRIRYQRAISTAHTAIRTQMAVL